MIAAELYHNLNRSDKSELSIVMDSQHRKGVKNLWNAFSKRLPSDPLARKCALFEAAFGRAWSHDQDYLLRNELRHFTSLIHDFLARKEMEKALKKDALLREYWLARAYEARGMDDLLPARMARLKKLADKQNRSLSDEASDWEIDQLVAKKEVRMDNYARIQSLCGDRLRDLEYTFLHQVRRVEEKRAHAERVLAILTPDFQFSPLKSSINLYSSPHNTHESKYLYHRSKSFSLKGYDQVEERKVALGHLRKSALPSISRNPKIITELAGIALQYSFLQEKGLADTYYKELVAFAADQQTAIPPEILFNLFSFWVKQGKFEDALAVYNENEAGILKNDKLKYRFWCVKGICHIFLEQPRSALHTIDADLQQRPPQENFYFRFVEMIALYQLGFSEDALRVAKNLQKIVTYHHHESSDVPYARITQLFIGFFKGVQEPPSTRKTILKDIIAQLLAVKESITPLHRDYLPLNWLFEQISGMIKD